MTARAIQAMLFDKDGTLFDFHKTWSTWAHEAILHLTSGDESLIGTLAAEMHYDLGAMHFLPTSPVIASTNREVAELMAEVLPTHSADEVEIYLSHSAAAAPLAPAVPLAPFLDDLVREGISLGVMTNDAELVAHSHLRAAGVADRFAFVAGFDSGFGSKPAPDPLLAFAKAVQIAPPDVAMVGDSTHDLIAGRAAGMRTIGVLTGTAGREELTPYADVVLPDIGHIPAWMRG